jgi:ABC-type phosphate transport system substrate-binding protein
MKLLLLSSTAVWLSLATFANVWTSIDGQIVQVHGSGTTNPSKCFWHIMDTLEQQSKTPITMTYRAIGSSTGQKEFIGDPSTNQTAIPVNDFGSGDIPVKTEDYDKLLADGVEMYHFPIFAGAISFFHSVPAGADTPINMTACVLAKIFNRDILDWNDVEIKELNPNLMLPDPYPVRYVHRLLGSSSTASITEYLHVACPEHWPRELVGATIEWPPDDEFVKTCDGSAGMTACIQATPGTIGYLDSGHGHSVEPGEFNLDVWVNPTDERRIVLVRFVVNGKVFLG